VSRDPTIGRSASETAGLNARPDKTQPASARAARRVRVVYCTRGGLFGALVLQRLQACERIEICGIVRSSRMMHPEMGSLRGALAYVRRSGIAYSLYLWCATTLADVLCRLARVKPVPMRTRRRRSPFIADAVEAGDAVPVSATPSVEGIIPVFTTRNLNDAKGMRFLAACAPDLLVSAFFDQRLHDAALGIPKFGCINIHPSLLPAYKGVDPVLQARLRGAPTIGVTVHRMVPDLDAGGIVAQRALITPKRASIFETTALLFREGAELLVLALERIERGAAGIEQDKSKGDYQSWPTHAEVSALRGLNVPLIRPSDFRRIRAALERWQTDLRFQRR
jgi:methionyl-tRNA formyltransferase